MAESATAGEPRTYAALHGAIQGAFRAARVEIVSPHFRAQRDGGATTVPQT